MPTIDTPQQVLPCPHCGGEMLVREHSAFHPNNDCWLAHAGEHGTLELDESDYPSWNQRALPKLPDVIDPKQRDVLVKLLQAMSVGMMYRKHRHDVILLAAAKLLSDGAARPSTQQSWKVWVALSANGSLVYEEINPLKAAVHVPRDGEVRRAVITLES